MDTLATPTILAALVLLASMASVELEHRSDIRDHLIALRPEGGDHRPSPVLGLITTVILSAIVPTFLAQRFFSPPVHALTPEQVEAVEDEEFEPAR